MARKLALASSVWSHIINESEISTDQRQDLTTLVETGELPVPAEEVDATRTQSYLRVRYCARVQEQSASVLFPGPSSEGSGTWKELVEDINYAHPRHPKHRPAAVSTKCRLVDCVLDFN